MIATQAAGFSPRDVPSYRNQCLLSGVGAG
jgi:hypothetical protein